jgi:threonine synthase
VAVPAAVEEIRHAEIRHNRECSVENMEKTVKEILGI